MRQVVLLCMASVFAQSGNASTPFDRASEEFASAMPVRTEAFSAINQQLGRCVDRVPGEVYSKLVSIAPSGHVDPVLGDSLVVTFYLPRIESIYAPLSDGEVGFEHQTPDGHLRRHLLRASVVAGREWLFFGSFYKSSGEGDWIEYMYCWLYR